MGDESELILLDLVQSFRIGGPGNAGVMLPPNIFMNGGLDPSMDQIMNFIMQNDPKYKTFKVFKKANYLNSSKYGPPPTSKQIIDELPVVKMTKEFISQEGVQECSVCKEEFKEGEEAHQIPCKHVFHKDCIMPWLTKVDILQLKNFS